MKLTKVTAILLFLGWLLLPIPMLQVSAQTITDERVSALSVEQKRLLTQRLKSFVEHQTSQQWEKQYDLLSSLTRRALTRKDYVETTLKAYSKWGRLPLLDFIPLDMRFVRVDPKQGVWMISGCSVVSEKGQRTSKPYVIETYWEKNNWYFSEFHEFLGDAGRNPCPVDTPKQQPIS